MEIGRFPVKKWMKPVLDSRLLKGKNMSYYVDFKVESKKNEGKRRVHSPGKESVLANVI